MPSWTIPAVPGFENPLDVLNNDHLLQGANGDSYIHNSTINNPNITIDNNFNNPIAHCNVAEDKPDAIPEERRFHLSLGLADPRLQQGSQHLGFGSLGADSGALSEILTATHEHPSLSFKPALTVLPTSSNSRFRQLFQQKMAAEASRQHGLTDSPNGSERAGTAPQQQDPNLDQSRPSWAQTNSMASGHNNNDNNLAVNTAQAEELAGYGREGDQDNLARPATSDGVLYLNNKSPAIGAQSQSGERHPASADANLPVPLPSWQNPMASSSGYRPQPQQSPYYQRMLAAKLAAAQQQEDLSVKDESNNYMPSMNQSDIAYMPSTYSPMYQMFSGGGGLDGHYQAQHAPQGHTEPWNMHAQQAHHQHYGPGSEDAGYLGLVNSGSNHSGSHNGGYPDQYNGHAAGTPWNQYYPSDGSNSRNPQGTHSQTPQPSVSGQWNRHDGNSEPEIPPPAVEDWMAAWPHIKNPGHEAPAKPAPAPASSSRKKADAEPKPKKDSSSAAAASKGAVAGGDAPKKAALACHFCRGRKLKCDAIRPTCSHCAKRSLNCSYDVEIRRRGPGKRKKELLAQQQARANGEPYQSDDTKNGSSRKRKSGHGENGSEQDDGSPSDSIGLNSGPDMSVQGTSSNVDQYSQQAYSAHSMSAPYDAYQQQQHYSNQMYPSNPVEAYHHSAYHAAAYHQQYDAVSNDRSRPMSHGYEVLGGSGPSYGQGYPSERPGGAGSDEHQSKRVKLEG